MGSGLWVWQIVKLLVCKCLHMLVAGAEVNGRRKNQTAWILNET